MHAQVIFLLWMIGGLITCIIYCHNRENPKLNDFGIIIGMAFWPIMLANEVRKWF